MKTYIKIILTLLIVLCSCQRAKNKGKELIDKSKTEVADVSKKAWKKSVSFVFNSFSSAEKVNLSDIYFDENIPEIDKIESVQINFPPNFYSCYFKYKSNKKEVIEFLSDLKTKHSDISDTKTEKTDGNEMKKNLKFIERKMPEFKKEILFFMKLKTLRILNFIGVINIRMRII